MMSRAESVMYSMKCAAGVMLKVLKFIGISLANGIGFILAVLLMIALFDIVVSLMLFMIPAVLYIGGPMWLAITVQVLIYIIAFNIGEHNGW